MAPCNGTQQWHHVHSPKVGRHPPHQPQYTTMAPYDGTQQWHHVHCTLQRHPGATSNPPKWFVALPPIGSKNPYSYRYLGKKPSLGISETAMWSWTILGCVKMDDFSPRKHVKQVAYRASLPEKITAMTYSQARATKTHYGPVFFFHCFFSFVSKRAFMAFTKGRNE